MTTETHTRTFEVMQDFLESRMRKESLTALGERSFLRAAFQRVIHEMGLLAESSNYVHMPPKYGRLNDVIEVLKLVSNKEEA